MLPRRKLLIWFDFVTASAVTFFMFTHHFFVEKTKEVYYNLINDVKGESIYATFDESLGFLGGRA